MRYYGAKTKLLSFIEEIVKETGVNGKHFDGYKEIYNCVNCYKQN